MTVPQQDEAIHRVDLIGSFDECQDRFGRNPLGLWTGVWQFVRRKYAPHAEYQHDQQVFHLRGPNRARRCILVGQRHFCL